MSGGSFCYLYSRDVASLFNISSETFENLEEMLSELKHLGLNEPAEETERLVKLIKESIEKADALRGKLEGIWHAVEWEVSGDGYAGQINDAVEAYRGHERERVLIRIVSVDEGRMKIVIPAWKENVEVEIDKPKYISVPGTYLTERVTDHEQLLAKVYLGAQSPEELNISGFEKIPEDDKENS